MRSRLIPGTQVRLSEIGVSLEESPRSTSSIPEGQQAVRLLQRYRSLGVTFFDTSTQDSAIALQHRLRLAFPEPDEEIVIAVGLRDTRGFGGWSSPKPSASLASEMKISDAIQESLAESARHLGKLRVGVVLVRMSSQLPAAFETVARTLNESVSRRVIKAWGVLWRDGRIEEDQVRIAIDSGANLVGFPLSLLDTDGYYRASQVFVPGQVGVLAYDPHANGRLDGSLLSQTPLDGDPRRGPTDVRQLQAEFGGVLRLGFLTEGRRRSLIQAAAQFSLAHTGVASVIVRSPSIRKLEELSRLEDLPTLRPDELDRARSLAAR